MFFPALNQNQQKPTDPGKVATLLMIIVLAMVMGCVFFAGFVVFQGALNKPAEGTQLSLIAVGMASTCIVLSLVIPPVVVKAVTRGCDGDFPTYLQAYMTKTIVALALLEGATFLAIIAFMNEHHWWTLAIAALLITLMLSHFPSRMRIEQWLDEHGCEDPDPLPGE